MHVQSGCSLFFLCPDYRTLAMNELDNVDGNCSDASLIFSRTRNFKKQTKKKKKKRKEKEKKMLQTGVPRKLIYLSLCLEIKYFLFQYIWVYFSSTYLHLKRLIELTSALQLF